MSEKKELATTSEKKPKRKRPDRTEACSVHTDPGDNTKYLDHSMTMFDWPEVDMTQPQEVKQRVGLYFGLCRENDMKPSVAGLALAFGVERNTLWRWANNVESKYIPTESRNLIKKAYQVLNAQMEDYAQNGKINPVTAIFLLKNHHNYSDRQDIVLTPNTQSSDSQTPEQLYQKYITDSAGDFEDAD